MPPEVRFLTRDDIPAVADLFIRVFRKRSSPAPASLVSCFIDLYPDNPWTRPQQQSLVYCDEQKKVRGFVGVLPLPLKLGNRKIVASVAGNHMVDPDLKDPFAGVLLLRKLFSSNPTLTISDSANEISRALWSKLGASVLTLYSMRWLRILRPSGYGLSLIPQGGGLSWVKPVLRPFTAVADLVGAGFFKPSGAGQRLTERPLDRDIYQRSFRDVVGLRALLPDYTPEELDWRLALAERKEQYGPLQKVAVEDSRGIAGWYMYYSRPGDTAQVLQVVARKGLERAVLNHLFKHAGERGAVALVGAIEPGAVIEYSDNQCLFFLRNMWTVAYSQDQEVLEALFRGDAFLSRLEGEWWTRLQGDRF